MGEGGMMYKNRIKGSGSENTFYYVTNRITGGALIFGELQKKYFRDVLFEGQNRHAFVVRDYVILGNHWHALVEVPSVDSMPRAEVLKRWLMSRRMKKFFDPGDQILEEFNRKIHDISFVIGNVEQRFTQWYNTQNDRWGRLFGGRFDSVIVQADTVLVKVMAYIALNPVRAHLVSDPADYRWSGYGERLAKGRLQPDDCKLAPWLAYELGLPGNIAEKPERECLDLMWKRFRERLLAGTVSDWNAPDVRTLEDKLRREGRPMDLKWPELFRLKVAFATRGVALGSREFVENILQKNAAKLGYKREHHAQETKVWNKIYCLKKHSRILFP
jgi:REP element-mobilizing transposase RayT